MEMLQEKTPITYTNVDPLDILYYDIEVFEFNNMVVFKNYEGETVKVFTNDLAGLGSIYDRGIVELGYQNVREFTQNKTLIGYNNYFYDDFILEAMSRGLKDKHIKEWNDSIIHKKSKAGMVKFTGCKTLDTFQQIDVSKPSLKRVEGNMGLSIEESKVDFNISRKLTPKENFETFEYCEYDVGQNRVIHQMRSEYFKSKDAIIQMLPENLREKAVKWNTTSIVGQLLAPRRKAPARRLVSDEMLEMVPHEVAEMWRELDTTMDFKFKKKKVIVEEFGNSIEFGWGGLHGVPKGFLKRTNVKLADAESMYPNILIILKGLGDKTEMYRGILNHRLELKHQGKEEEQAPYKLILNLTYGLLNNKYSQINNPHLAYSICIYGQISLYVLAQRLAAIGADILNINTDGVAYNYEGDEDELIKRQWESDFGLKLATDLFDKWIQLDVNNYIALEDNGNITTKGGYVNKYHKPKYFANNDIRIVQIALVNHVLYGKDVAETIMENLHDPVLYQYILHPGHTYRGVVNSHDSDNILPTKTNRVFATKKQGLEIVKKRMDGGLVKFADAPDNMFLWNKDVKDLTNFKDIIDLQWYYDLTMKNLEKWRA